MKELSYITFKNIKKLFNWKNLLLFIIVLFCIWTVYYSFQMIINFTAQFTSDSYSKQLAKWRFSIIFLNMYLNFFISYSYIFLKKNNLASSIEYKTKGNVSNLIIISSLFILFYATIYIFFFLYFKDIKYDQYGNILQSYKATNFLFLFFLIFNFGTVVFIDLFNKQIAFKYVLLLFSGLINITLFIYVWQWLLRINSVTDLEKFKSMCLIEGTIVVFLIIVNVFRKYWIHKNHFEKDKTNIEYTYQNIIFKN